MVKLKLVYNEDDDKGIIIDMRVLPRLSEHIVTPSGEFQVIQVVHTPTEPEFAAMVVVSKKNEPDRRELPS